jgi:hypothetical protein
LEFGGQLIEPLLDLRFGQQDQLEIARIHGRQDGL